MLIITGKQMREIQSLDNGVIVLEPAVAPLGCRFLRRVRRDLYVEEEAVTVPIEESAGRPILLYAHQVAALLEANKWDADEAAAGLSTEIHVKRRGGDTSWNQR